MTVESFYKTIDQPSTAIFKDKGSKFLAFAYPIKNVQEFKAHIAELKKLHPKAVHYCFAYKIGTKGLEFRQSDDGEPSGTAGKPIMNVIDSFSLTDVLIVVVRYFGGTLLGVPGLINAYKSAATSVLQDIEIVEKPIEAIYEISVGQGDFNEAMTLLKQLKCNIMGKEMGEECIVTFGVVKNMEEILLAKFKGLYRAVLKKKG